MAVIRERTKEQILLLEQAKEIEKTLYEQTFYNKHGLEKVHQHLLSLQIAIEFLNLK
jgi:hypothetical protein